MSDSEYCDFQITDRDGGAPSDWRSLRAIVLHRDCYVCRVCGDRATEVDHVWPKSEGGSDALSNLQAICRTCNATKGDGILVQHITVPRLADAGRFQMKQAMRAVRWYARWHRLKHLVMLHMSEFRNVPTIEDMTAYDRDSAEVMHDSMHLACAVVALAKNLGLVTDDSLVDRLVGTVVEPEAVVTPLRGLADPEDGEE
jgi:hypothetical protein